MFIHCQVVFLWQISFPKKPIILILALSRHILYFLNVWWWWFGSWNSLMTNTFDYSFSLQSSFQQSLGFKGTSRSAQVFQHLQFPLIFRRGFTCKWKYPEHSRLPAEITASSLMIIQERKHPVCPRCRLSGTLTAILWFGVALTWFEWKLKMSLSSS